MIVVLDAIVEAYLSQCGPASGQHRLRSEHRTPECLLRFEPCIGIGREQFAKELRFDVTVGLDLGERRLQRQDLHHTVRRQLRSVERLPCAQQMSARHPRSVPGADPTGKQFVGDDSDGPHVCRGMREQPGSSDA